MAMSRNPTKRPRATLALALSALSWGCFSDRPTVPTEGPVSFADDVQPILAGSCALSGCHGANANPAEKPMVLSVGQAYDNIVGVASAELPAMPRVSPSQPDNSYLIHKIQGMHLSVGGSGDRMPLGQPALSQPTIDLIRRWITEGALRN